MHAHARVTSRVTPPDRRHRAATLLATLAAATAVACGAPLTPPAITAASDVTASPVDTPPSEPSEPAYEASDLPPARIGRVAVHVSRDGYLVRGELVRGTLLDLRNESFESPHSVAVIRLADDEARPVSVLAQLPPEEIGDLVGIQVALARGVGVPVERDLVLAEAGRYLLLDVLPHDVTHDLVKRWVVDDLDRSELGDSPTHGARGVVAEVIVR